MRINDAAKPQPSTFAKATADKSNAALIGRREAIRRAALLAGVALSPEWLSIVGRAQTPATRTYLTAAQGPLVSAAAERILPRTDTPGAIDVGVPAFIDRFYGEFMSPAERQLLVSALDEIEKVAHERTAHRSRRSPPRSRTPCSGASPPLSRAGIRARSDCCDP